MGAGFVRTRTLTCGGQHITAHLDNVFGNPASNAFADAKLAIPNFQGIVNAGNVPDNWKDLVIAYLVAGVDVGNEFPSWVAYLEQLGTNNPAYIVAIAQARLTALTTNTGFTTHTHNPNTGGHAPIVGANSIDSPCPP